MNAALTAMIKFSFILIITIILAACSKSEHEIAAERHSNASKALFQDTDESKYKEAFEYLHSEYKAGSAYSAGKLGWAYQKGLGVEPDLKRAIELYEFAANRGMTYWQYLLAHAYEQGYFNLGIDLEKKEYWLNQSNKVHRAKYECWVVTYYEMGIYPSAPDLKTLHEQRCNDS